MNEYNDYDIKSSFISEEEISNIIYKVQSEVQIKQAGVDSYQEKKDIEKKYRQEIFVRINIALRRQPLLDLDTAIKYYDNNKYVFNERVSLFYNIIERLNSDILQFTFNPDRFFVSSFFRITVNAYNKILNDPTYSRYSDIKMQFQAIEEFILSMTLNSLEQGTIRGYGMKKLQLKAKYGGNEIESVESNNNFNANNKNNNYIDIEAKDVENRLVNKYNFKELENSSSDSNDNIDNKDNIEDINPDF